jgi:hypothetical protein
MRFFAMPFKTYEIAKMMPIISEAYQHQNELQFSYLSCQRQRFSYFVSDFISTV